MKKIKNNLKNFEIEPTEVDIEIRKCELCGKLITRDWCEDDEVDENDFCSERCFKKGSGWYGDWWDN